MVGAGQDEGVKVACSISLMRDGSRFFSWGFHEYTVGGRELGCLFEGAYGLKTLT